MLLPGQLNDKKCISIVYIIQNGGPLLLERIAFKMVSISKLYTNKCHKLFERMLDTLNKLKISLRIKKAAPRQFHKPGTCVIKLKDQTELNNFINQHVLMSIHSSNWGTNNCTDVKR